MMAEIERWLGYLSLEALEVVYQWLKEELHHRRRHHHHGHRRIVGAKIIVGLHVTNGKEVKNMADQSIAANQFLPLTAGSQMSDGTVEELQTADPAATVAWSEDSNGALITLSATAGFSVDADGVKGANGTATVTAVETLADGRSFTATLTIAVTPAAVTIVGGTIIAGTPALQ